MFNLTELTTNQLTLIGFIGTITGLLIYVRRKLTFWERRGINGPKVVIPFWQILDGKPISVKLMDNAKYGKFYGGYNGLSPVIVVSDPELIRTICIKDFHSWPQGFVNESYIHPVEKHLANLYGEQWKRMRSLLSPTFSSGKIKKMFLLMKACTDSAHKALTKMTSNGQVKDFDPKYFWGRYNLDVIAKCCFAADLDVYGDKEDVLLKRFQKVFIVTASMLLRALTVLAFPSWIVQKLKISIADHENLEFFRNLTQSLIEKRKNVEVKPNDFLQLMLDLGDEGDEITNNEKGTKLTIDEIVASSFVFLIAGYETTSTLLTWACYRLATNPDIQEKLYEEISQADTNDYETLSSLPYLDAVINETLRIDPPVLLFQRKLHSDYSVPGSNLVLQKGIVCNLPIYTIHHDPDNYSNPEVFDPDRFINDPPKPLTFLPFGAGPRTCIGMRFALINAKLALSSLVRDYIIHKTPKTPEKMEHAVSSIILSPKNLTLGLKLRS